jgi:phospholipid/cholesterol/gamma-HCH transport system permease protein
MATTFATDMTLHAYVQATLDATKGAHLIVGLTKCPFLPLGIGLIACSQGLLTSGGAAAVGARTTSAGGAIHL